MQVAFAISESVNTFFAPEEPRVSTLIDTPSFSPAFLSASSAIYVCAIPVGHAVTAKMLALSTLFSACASFALSAASTAAINSSIDFADFSDAVNFSSKRSTDNLLNTSTCTLSFVFGAAIKNITFTFSPSGASKSTPEGNTIAAKPGAFTESLLQCGIATPSPTAVVLSFSRAKTPSRYVSVSAILPLFAIKSTILLIASFLSEAEALSSMLSLLKSSEILIRSPLIYRTYFFLKEIFPDFPIFYIPLRSSGKPIHNIYSEMPLYADIRESTSDFVARFSLHALAVPVQSPDFSASR